jgi:hypothetical protein
MFKFACKLLVLLKINLHFVFPAVSYILIEPNCSTVPHCTILKACISEPSENRAVEKFSIVLYDIASRRLYSRFDAWMDG